MEADMINGQILQKPFRAEFWDGPMNGARRYYKTLGGAKVAAKNYIRSANKNWSDCRAYVEIYRLDSNFNATKIEIID